MEQPSRVDLEGMAGAELRIELWRNHERLLSEMRSCQLVADKARLSVKQAVSAQHAATSDGADTAAKRIHFGPIST